MWLISGKWYRAENEGGLNVTSLTRKGVYTYTVQYVYVKILKPL